MTAAGSARNRTPPRRRWLPLVLVVAFVIVPLVEIYVLVQVGQVIGAWWTILLLVADSMLGAWLMRREGAKAWRALTTALSSSRMPGTELADAAIILVAGTLMLTPGFVSDLVGFALLIPLTRPLARRVLAAVVTRRLVGAAMPQASGRQHPDSPRPGDGPAGPVVQGEVVDD